MTSAEQPERVVAERQGRSGVGRVGANGLSLGTVVVTENGCQVLTTTSRELTVK